MVTMVTAGVDDFYGADDDLPMFLGRWILRFLSFYGQRIWIEREQFL